MAFKRSGVRFPAAPWDLIGTARVAELVDAQGSGPCGGKPREGSSPSSSMVDVLVAHVLELVDRLV